MGINAKPSRSIPKQAACNAQLVFDPDLEVIEILAGDGVIPKQKAPAHDPIHHMHDRDFTGGKHFRTRRTSHHCLRLLVLSLNARTTSSGRPALDAVHCWIRFKNNRIGFASKLQTNLKHSCVPVFRPASSADDKKSNDGHSSGLAFPKGFLTVALAAAPQSGREADYRFRDGFSIPMNFLADRRDEIGSLSCR